MAIADEIVQFLGFELGEDTTVDKFKDWSEKNLISVKSVADHPVVKKYVGERLGSNETSVKKAFKEAGVEFEDGAAKTFGDLLEAGTRYLSDRQSGYESKIEALKKGSPDKTADFEAKIAEIHDLKNTNKDLTATVNSLRTGIEEKETVIKSHESEKEDFIFSQLRQKQHSELGIDPQANKHRVKGWLAEMNETYQTKLVTTVKEDGTKEYGLDIRTLSGEQVPSADKHGEFMDYASVYKQSAAKDGLLKINQDGGKPAPQMHKAQPNSRNEPPAKAKYRAAGGSPRTHLGR